MTAATAVAGSRASATAATTTVTRASATAVAATIAVVRRTTVRARSNDRLPHIERRTRRSAVATALWTIATACRTRTGGRSVRAAGRSVRICTTHGWASGGLTPGVWYSVVAPAL